MLERKSNEVREAILKEFGVDIYEKTRRKKTVDFRKAVITMLYESGYSKSEIGKIFNQDHTTVINAIRKHYEYLYTNDPIYLEMVHFVRQFFPENKQKIEPLNIIPQIKEILISMENNGENLRDYLELRNLCKKLVGME